jgi:RNA polymerase sigma-70 factor, ECF subfamily
MPPAAFPSLADRRDVMAPAPPADRSGQSPESDASRPDERAGDEGVRSHELALVRAAQRGEESAFGTLVRLNQRRAYAVARAIVGTHEDAEDVVQETFLHAHRALARFRPEQGFGAWLHRIAANAALDLLRRRRVRATEPLQDAHALPFRDPAEAAELRGRLEAGLARLTDRQRAVIVLHDVEGFRHAEIGEMLGIPEGTARSDLHHARKLMRRAMDDFRMDA